MIRTVLILSVTGLMACDSDNPSGGDDTNVLTPDVMDTSSPDTTADTTDTSVPDTTPDTTADTTPDTTADTTPDTTADTTPDTTADTTPDTTADTMADTTPEPDTSAGACDNTTDFNTLAGLQATLEAKIQTCAFECLGQGAGCAATCVERETSLTSACSACFGEVIACTISNCALQCLDAGSQNCATCRDTNCTPAFEDCAGISQP